MEKTAVLQMVGPEDIRGWGGMIPSQKMNNNMRTNGFPL
jgi:hypothetical protein